MAKFISFEKRHEPQKVVVPKFVAEWIKKYKENGYRLAHALEKVFDDDYTEVIHG